MTDSSKNQIGNTIYEHGVVLKCKEKYLWNHLLARYITFSNGPYEGGRTIWWIDLEKEIRGEHSLVRISESVIKECYEPYGRLKSFTVSGYQIGTRIFFVTNDKYLERFNVRGGLPCSETYSLDESIIPNSPTVPL